MSLFPSCDNPLTIRPRVKRNGRTEWHAVNPETGKILRACEAEEDAMAFAESWASGIDAIEDGVAGLTVAGVFVPSEGGRDDN